MPRVKIDYVVSFSSEDPEHPASNLLQWEVSKKKWLCQKGESSCSVVLQLPRPVKITGVHIGAYHAASVEVLVGRAETSSEQFQVLVPSSVFISREESRRDVPAVRVRSFGTSALSTPARDQRWDRVRVVCAQPHNKHCQFGLSFVHVDEAAPALGPRLLALDTLSSDEDDFKPGELFAKHLQSTSGELQPNTNMSTGQQIRQATSQALKNIPDSSTKLLKTPFSKPTATRARSPLPASGHTRRDNEHDQSSKTTKHDDIDKHNNINKKRKGDSNTKEESKIKNETKTKAEPKRTPRGNEHDSPSSDQNKEMRKRKRPSQEVSIPGPAPPRLLQGCVLVLSGYVHPRRAAVRDLALAMGARVRPDWGPGATHLICAFPNTPKLRAVRAADPRVPVVLAEWLEQVSARRRLLPWRWFATEPHLRLAPDDLPTDDPPTDDPPTDEPAPDTRHTQDDSDGDTDDEIEKVLQAQKKRRLTESKRKNEANKRDDSPVTTTSDVTRAASPDTDDAASTDDEGAGRGSPGAAPSGPAALPDFFSGLTFLVCASPRSVLRMSRYVRAYGGLVLEMSEVAEGSEVDYIVRGRGADLRHVPATCSPRAGHVSAAWLARCHDAKARLPHEHTLTEIS